MDCKKAQRKLEAYLGGELSGEERLRMEQHLASCSDCRRTLHGARQLHETLGRGGTPPLPEGFHARLMEKARQRAERRGWTDKILRPLGWKPAMSTGMRAAVAAAVIVGLGVGTLIGRDMWRGQKPPEPQPPQVTEADPGRTYRVDYFSEAPNDSLAGTYVSLVSAEGGE